MIQFIQAYKTSDGKIFEHQDEAQAYEGKQEFIDWCNLNICIGGEWSSHMVATRILEEWQVKYTLGPKKHEPKIIKPLAGPNAVGPDDQDDDIPF